MTPGREYGMLKYGRGTYDKTRDLWVPSVTPSLTEVWIPSVTPSLTEVWVPAAEPPHWT